MGSIALADDDHWIPPWRGVCAAVAPHVDADRAVLWIHRSNARTKAGIKEKDTKTGQHRKVALDPQPGC